METAVLRSRDTVRFAAPRGLLVALAVVVALAAPGASVAWYHGSHATPEQAALHRQAREHGHENHHGNHHHDPAGTGTNLCATLTGALGLSPGTVALYAGSATARSLLDSLQSDGCGPPALASPDRAPPWRVLTPPGSGQTRPAPLLRPPISS